MSRRFTINLSSIAAESLDTTKNQQTQEQAQIVKEAASKEAETEIKPLIEKGPEANPDASVSGQPGMNGDSSVNGEKPTAGIDSGSEEFSQALEDLSEEINQTLIDVNTMLDQSDDAQRLSTVVSSVQSPTETDLALIKLAADVADIGDADERIAAESIDDIRKLINKQYQYSTEGIGESILNVFKGIISWFRAKLIMMRSTAGRLRKLETLLVKHRGKQFTFAAKPSNFHYIPEGDTSRFLSNSAEFKEEVQKSLDMVLNYMTLFGQGITYMERDFNRAVTSLLKSDDEKANIAKVEYHNYIEKMVDNIQKGLGLQKTNESMGEMSYYESEAGVGGIVITAQRREMTASEAAEPTAKAFASGIRESRTGISFVKIYDKSTNKETFEVATNDLLEVVRNMSRQVDKACRIFDSQIMTPLYTLEGYLENSDFTAFSSNDNAIVKGITIAQNARAAAQRFSTLGRMLTALAENTKEAAWGITDLIDELEASVSRFITAAVTSREISK